MPRIMFDLFGKVLLIQHINMYNMRGHQHKIVLSSNDILSSLPDHICNIFPILFFPRRTSTNSNVARGMTFAKISESIAEVNFLHHWRRGMIKNSAREGRHLMEEPFNESEFYTNELYLFPSNDHIMSIFMVDFDNKKAIYQNKMKKVTGCAILHDHPFRISKKHREV